METNNTAGKKYCPIATDHRVLAVRVATIEECEGEAGWVMITLRPQFASRDGDQLILVCGVGDARKRLAEVVWSEEG
jgi:hypothetical protein